MCKEFGPLIAHPQLFSVLSLMRGHGRIIVVLFYFDVNEAGHPYAFIIPSVSSFIKYLSSSAIHMSIALYNFLHISYL